MQTIESLLRDQIEGLVKRNESLHKTIEKQAADLRFIRNEAKLYGSNKTEAYISNLQYNLMVLESQYSELQDNYHKLCRERDKDKELLKAIKKRH